ncbi:hypothetical protein KKB18_11510 [bacterium]|nr:hypothetical protein [bacterium]
MRRSIRNIENRGKQNLIINLVIGIVIILIISIVFYDALKPEKTEKTEKVVVLEKEPDSNKKTLEIPRRKTPKPRTTQAKKREEYKKYQSHFNEGKGVDEKEFDYDSEYANE